uniref:Uncharacterized protein n=1 Tax=Scophthalmus maximus TaxID=52904 RepID=A0A8D3DDU7_SCOMX
MVSINPAHAGFWLKEKEGLRCEELARNGSLPCASPPNSCQRKSDPLCFVYVEQMMSKRPIVCLTAATFEQGATN